MSKKTELLSTILLDHRLIEKAGENGMELDAMSFIQVSSNTESDLHAEMEELCDLPVTAVFTSVNAVHAIAHIIHDTKPRWNIYCTGGATKNALLESFDEAAIKGTANDAAKLADVIIADDVLEVVFFCGDKRMDTLPDVLRQQDITVHELIVYHTVETPLVVTKHYDGVLFYSPSAVDSFFSVNTIGSTIVFFAIGNTTAAAIRQKAANTVIVSETPSKEHLLDMAIAYFQKTV